jgi:hypothetical protein
MQYTVLINIEIANLYTIFIFPHLYRIACGPKKLTLLIKEACNNIQQTIYNAKPMKLSPSLGFYMINGKEATPIPQHSVNEQFTTIQ